jgi:hypothetical protein
VFRLLFSCDRVVGVLSGFMSVLRASLPFSIVLESVLPLIYLNNKCA